MKTLFFVLSLLSLIASAIAADGGAYAPTITVTPLLKTQVDGTGRTLVYPTGEPEVTAVRVEIPPGMQTNWHKHPVPCFAYMLEGELEVELANGVTKKFKAGEAMAEVADVLHNGVNRSAKTARLVMFVIGAVGQPYAVRPQPEAKAGTE